MLFFSSIKIDSIPSSNSISIFSFIYPFIFPATAAQFSSLENVILPQLLAGKDSKIAKNNSIEILQLVKSCSISFFNFNFVELKRRCNFDICWRNSSTSTLLNNRSNKKDSKAGLHFAEYVQSKDEGIPIIIQTTELSISSDVSHITDLILNINVPI